MEVLEEKLHFDKSTYDQWKDDLKDGNQHGNSVLVDKRTVRFEDGTEVDVKVVGTDRTPYLDIVFFDQNGHSIGHSEPCYDLESDHSLEVEGKEYKLNLVSPNQQA